MINRLTHSRPLNAFLQAFRYVINGGPAYYFVLIFLILTAAGVHTAIFSAAASYISEEALNNNLSAEEQARLRTFARFISALSGIPFCTLAFLLPTHRDIQQWSSPKNVFKSLYTHFGTMSSSCLTAGLKIIAMLFVAVIGTAIVGSFFALINSYYLWILFYVIVCILLAILIARSSVIISIPYFVFQSEHRNPKLLHIIKPEKKIYFIVGTSLSLLSLALYSLVYLSGQKTSLLWLSFYYFVGGFLYLAHISFLSKIIIVGEKEPVKRIGFLVRKFLERKKKE